METINKKGSGKMNIDKNHATLAKCINELDETGFVSINYGKREIFIQSVDDKEGYSFVSNTNEEFANSEAAIKWAFEQLLH